MRTFFSSACRHRSLPSGEAPQAAERRTDSAVDTKKGSALLVRLVVRAGATRAAFRSGRSRFDGSLRTSRTPRGCGRTYCVQANPPVTKLFCVLLSITITW